MTQSALYGVDGRNIWPALEQGLLQEMSLIVKGLVLQLGPQRAAATHLFDRAGAAYMCAVQSRCAAPHFQRQACSCSLRYRISRLSARSANQLLRVTAWKPRCFHSTSPVCNLSFLPRLSLRPACQL